MTNSNRECQEQLAKWLLRLIETLRFQGADTWKVLVQIVSGKTAAIALDGTALQISAEGGDRLQLSFEYTVPPDSINFRSDADTLRDIVAGKLTVDGAVADGRIYVRNSLDELLSIYEILMRILADSTTNLHLQELWMEFDESWPSSATGGLPLYLEGQKPSYAYLIKRVPQDVLAIEVQPYLVADDPR